MQLLRFVLALLSTAVPRRAHGTPSRLSALLFGNTISHSAKPSGNAPIQHRSSQLKALFPGCCHPRAKNPRLWRYQNSIQSPTASAANASGFLLVSLSKMPRPRLRGFARASCAEAFPIKASDYAAK